MIADATAICDFIRFSQRQHSVLQHIANSKKKYKKLHFFSCYRLVTLKIAVILY